MNEQKEKVDILSIFAKVLKMKVIPKPSKENNKNLRKMGFKIGKGKKDFVSIVYPYGWTTKEIVTGSVVGIFDQFNRPRVNISFVEKEDEKSIIISLIPRFKIMGPYVERCGHPTIEAFVGDNYYHFGNPEYIILKETLELEEGKSFENKCPTALKLLGRIETSLKQRYPEYLNPLMYWS